MAEIGEVFKEAELAGLWDLPGVRSEENESLSTLVSRRMKGTCYSGRSQMNLAIQKYSSGVTPS